MSYEYAGAAGLEDAVRVVRPGATVPGSMLKKSVWNRFAAGTEVRTSSYRTAERHAHVHDVARPTAVHLYM
eukprot:COSAG01_NODE_3836_length_5649_cov_1.967748_1_plen_71_part_00